MGHFVKNNSIGEKIRAARLEARLTQWQAADLIGVNASQIARYESNQITPPADKYLSLLDIDKLAKKGGVKKSKRKLKGLPG